MKDTYDYVQKVCPECGSDLDVRMLLVHPPIKEYVCRCGFRHQQKPKVVKKPLDIEED
jgi:predicted RNA-binding Zn-ribbon protein involved in translation (DUF1610 family)